MDVVLYMRYSSDRQTEQSIEGQRRICMDFCQKQGYTVVGSYIDRATSAFKDTAKRTEFNKMIKDSDRQLWQAVIVYKLDRFARNRYDSATYKAKLKKNGVRVISATENISDNPEGVILEAVLEGMAEFYSKELSQKINRGLMESAYKCNSVGGQIPLGYKIENKKLVIYEPTAEIVREAFDLYAGGMTIAEICNAFNNKGYRTAKGKLFNKNSFSSMFRNEKYVGVYTYRDIRIEGGVPAIVDKETFEAVQRRLISNGEAPARGKAKVEYLLSQKLFCGHCGSLMIGETGRGRRGKSYHYYSCSKRKRFNSCDKKPLPKDFIERAVVEDALSLFTPERIERLADMAIKQNREDIENDSIIPPLKEELKDLEKKTANLLKLAETGVESDALAARLKELEAQKKDIRYRIANAEDSYIVLEKPHVVWFLTRFSHGDTNDEDFRRSVINHYVNSVTVWDEPDGGYRVTILYNVLSDNQKTLKLSAKNEGSDLDGKLPPRRRKLHIACDDFFCKKLNLSSDKLSFFELNVLWTSIAFFPQHP